MKIHSYDANNKVIVASFSTDQSLKPVEEYNLVAIDVTQFEANDVDTLLKEIAAKGVVIALRNDKKEQASSMTVPDTELEKLSGEVFSYDAVDIPNLVYTGTDKPNIVIS